MSFAPTYCASKHGVIGFSRSMVVSPCSQQLGTIKLLLNLIYPQNCYLTDDVRVNCVCPEFTETRMVSDMMTSYGQLAHAVQQVQQAQQQAQRAVTSIGLLRSV